MEKYVLIYAVEGALTLLLLFVVRDRHKRKSKGVEKKIYYLLSKIIYGFFVLYALIFWGILFVLFNVPIPSLE